MHGCPERKQPHARPPLTGLLYVLAPISEVLPSDYLGSRHHTQQPVSSKLVCLKS